MLSITQHTGPLGEVECKKKEQVVSLQSAFKKHSLFASLPNPSLSPPFLSLSLSLLSLSEPTTRVIK